MASSPRPPAVPWLTILGIGDNGLDSLTPAARLLFDEAQAVIAPERVLHAIPAAALAGKTVTPWTSRVHETIRALHQRRGEPVTILATGDPLHYGIAASLARSIPYDEIRTIPHPSGFSLAANRLGWPLQDVDCLSLHGRAVARIQLFIEPGNRLLALTSNGETVSQAASLLVGRGFENSRLSVLEHIGGTRERILHLTAAEAVHCKDFADFNMLAVECIAGPRAILQSRLAGLPNDAFRHDGQLTKREVRAATLAALAPYPNALLWDIGAGCGSVAIEWMRAARGARAIAFERDPRRLAMIAENAPMLGVPDLGIIAGSAPECLPAAAEDHKPDAVFIGGGLAGMGVFDAAWTALRPGGVLVANTVTLEGEAGAIALQAAHGGDLVRLDVAHLTQVGRMRALEPRMSVLQWRVLKP
ncbi:MAG: precorrin-6y C5,15-methyltransferase (decarboxylating) subunit CbiE [Rhizobiales bacterium]|nr:precorrin-6y C5,15-methyltransferase (decarboxylating) subunit CbiE [Hyphomicrobiales bacterium]